MSAPNRLSLLCLGIVAGASSLIAIRARADGPTTKASDRSAIVTAHLADDARAYCAALRETHPPLRGFRAPWLLAAQPDPRTVGFPMERWPVEWPNSTADAALRAAASTVGQRLARDGLLATTIQVLMTPGLIAKDADDAAVARTLRAVGIPVDLVDMFEPPEIDPAIASTQRRGMLAELRVAFTRGTSAADLRGQFATAPFRFRPAVPSFRLNADSGEQPLGLLRLQLTRGTDWMGPGDGGSVDLARQLISSLPDTRFLIGIQDSHASEFSTELARWPGAPSNRVRIINQPLPLAQWARDNAVVGVDDAAGSSKRTITLAPRYASRGEDGARLVPGETLAAQTLIAAGFDVRQSPLLFQGGDLLCVEDPQRRERILLIGEAELYRNMALGLRRPEVLEAFRVEMGVDQVVVLPAASFHIDFEVSVRRVGDRIVAFMNDELALAKGVLGCGVSALEKRSELSAESAVAARAALAENRFAAFAGLMEPIFTAHARGYGQFAQDFADLFSAGPVDSGVGNLQHFLHALDVWASAAPDDELPDDRQLRAMLGTLVRRRLDRAEIRRKLEALGWTVVLIPSEGDSRRGINYLNGVHAPGRFLMPAYGGLFAPLDKAAASALSEALPGVEITPILCGESQRREGGLRCSVSVYPEHDP